MLMKMRKAQKEVRDRSQDENLLYSHWDQVWKKPGWYRVLLFLNYSQIINKKPKEGTAKERALGNIRIDLISFRSLAIYNNLHWLTQKKWLDNCKLVYVHFALTILGKVRIYTLINNKTDGTLQLCMAIHLEFWQTNHWENLLTTVLILKYQI